MIWLFRSKPKVPLSWALIWSQIIWAFFELFELYTTLDKSGLNLSCLYATVRSINLFSGLYVDRLWLKERNMGTNLPSTWPHFHQETPLWLSKYSTRLWTNAQKYNRCQSQVLGFLTLNYTGNQGFIQIIFSLTFSNILYLFEGKGTIWSLI